MARIRQSRPDLLAENLALFGEEVGLADERRLAHIRQSRPCKTVKAI